MPNYLSNRGVGDLEGPVRLAFLSKGVAEELIVPVYLDYRALVYLSIYKVTFLIVTGKEVRLV